MNMFDRLFGKKHPEGTPEEPVPPFVIAETAQAVWNYHIRRTEGKLYPGGGAPPALCGKTLGWDTKIPLTAWGVKSHIPTFWCSKCQELYQKAIRG